MKVYCENCLYKIGKKCKKKKNASYSVADGFVGNSYRQIITWNYKTIKESKNNECKYYFSFIKFIILSFLYFLTFFALPIFVNNMGYISDSNISSLLMYLFTLYSLLFYCGFLGVIF